jgi:hypothetical protein
MKPPFTLKPDYYLGGLSHEGDNTPLYDAEWYSAGAVNDGLVYQFETGALAQARWLSADMLLAGDEAGVFVLDLQAGDEGPVFSFQYGLLPGAAARMRVPLDAVNQNRWLYGREGTWVKPHVHGQRVNLRQVDRLSIRVVMQGNQDTRWCMTPLLVTIEEPARIEQPALPQGHLLDELGQNTLRDWPGKSRSADMVSDRLRAQLDNAPLARWPDGFSRWGGWEGKTFEASGFFRTEWDGERWWLVDPDGFAFWSAGQNCVRSTVTANVTGLERALAWMPNELDYEFAAVVRHEQGATHVDYLQANLMRAFGPNTWYTHWAEIALAELRQTGFNTLGNWSEWEIASDVGFPYVRPLVMPATLQTPFIYRDLPDVFDPAFEADAAAFAQQLSSTHDDPALIGYFLMNEPQWAFAGETPAAGMLFTTASCASRRALADFLRERYGDEKGLANAWRMDVTFDQLTEGVWTGRLTEIAEADLADFSAVLIERYFSTLSAACRKVDANHLNLGSRYFTVPPDWALQAMHSFDVFSMNCYQELVPADALKTIHETIQRPTLIGEWHMGALDVGLPASGVGPRVNDQAARGQAYRVYLENAAALPWCIGAHHFQFYDQSALGRDDGEAYNIGFLDICHRPYDALVMAARQAHRRMYPVALGAQPPFNDAPNYWSAFFF